MGHSHFHPHVHVHAPGQVDYVCPRQHCNSSEAGHHNDAVSL
jgi:hypothetical protein